jgi:hypothetical protein
MAPITAATTIAPTIIGMELLSSPPNFLFSTP